MTEIGVKRGEVRLCDHDEAWRTIATETIEKLKKLLGDAAEDIQHVGSTSIYDIKAKPIIDIAVSVKDFEDVLKYERKLMSEGFYYRTDASNEMQLLFASGSYYDGTGDLQTHFIHVVKADSVEWQNYIMFREHLNHYKETAMEYEALKLSLAHKNREEYTKGKHDFIQKVLRNAIIDRMPGQT